MSDQCLLVVDPYVFIRIKRNFPSLSFYVLNLDIVLIWLKLRNLWDSDLHASRSPVCDVQRHYVVYLLKALLGFISWSFLWFEDNGLYANTAHLQRSWSQYHNAVLVPLIDTEERTDDNKSIERKMGNDTSQWSLARSKLRMLWLKDGVSNLYLPLMIH